MAQIFDAPSKAILRSQIAEHIAENDNNDRRVDQEGEAPLPKDRFFDRELSWLKFNQRVLECAENEDMPLLERANFAAIFASNLDEFFMVRVAGLKRRIDTGIAVTSASGLSPRQQMRAISEQAHRLQDEHAHYVVDTILPELAKQNIQLLGWDKLTIAEQERLTIHQRQREGINAAKAKGKHLGRPSTSLPDNWEEVLALWQSGEITAREAMRRTGMKRTTFYRRCANN